MKQPITLSGFLMPSLVFLFSCNKPDNNAKSNTPLYPNVNGVLSSIKIEFDSAYPFPPASLSQQASAFFYSTPGTAPAILVDTVYVNNIGLNVTTAAVNKHLGYSENSDNNPQLDMNGTSNWQIVGNGVIPSFSYNFSTPYPSFTGNLPDTFSLANGVSFNLNFTDADSIVIAVTSVNHNLQPIITKTYLPNTTHFTLSPADLKYVNPSSKAGVKGYFMIYAYKYVTQSFGNKDFLFLKTYQFHHGVWANQ